jgi:hypothetical protein
MAMTSLPERTLSRGMRGGFDLDAHENRGLIHQTERSRIFSFELERDRFLQIVGKFIKGLALRDDGQVKTLRYEVGFALVNMNLDDLFHSSMVMRPRGKARDKSIFAGNQARATGELRRRLAILNMEDVNHYRSAAVHDDNVAPDDDSVIVRRKRREAAIQVDGYRPNPFLESGRKMAALDELPLKTGREAIALGQARREVALVAIAPFAEDATVAVGEGVATIIAVVITVLVFVLSFSLAFALPLALGESESSGKRKKCREAKSHPPSV